MVGFIFRSAAGNYSLASARAVFHRAARRARAPDSQFPSRVAGYQLPAAITYDGRERLIEQHQLAYHSYKLMKALIEFIRKKR